MKDAILVLLLIASVALVPHAQAKVMSPPPDCEEEEPCCPIYHHERLYNVDKSDWDACFVSLDLPVPHEALS